MKLIRKDENISITNKRPAKLIKLNVEFYRCTYSRSTYLQKSRYFEEENILFKQMSSFIMLLKLFRLTLSTSGLCRHAF